MREWPHRAVLSDLRSDSFSPDHPFAVELHPYWQQACVTLDPHDFLSDHAVIAPPQNAGSQLIVVQRLTPYRHFRLIINTSCIICRINYPFTNHGLGEGRKPIRTVPLGVMKMCRVHKRATSAFCGVCLRDAPPFENETEGSLVSCVENDDVETWPGVEATCRTCREEALLRRAMGNPRDREAVGGPRWESPDWETRQTIDTFIEMGEGTITDVINVALEKHWLRSNTKLSNLLSQALAASRFASREDAAAGGGGYDSEELSDDEEDPELLSLTEDAGGVRDLAINDWARIRILDGHWYSPADQYYGNRVPNKPTVVPAHHPCPWTLDKVSLQVIQHPQLELIRSEVPSSFTLCDQVYRGYQRQMRLILSPAMQNVVRKLVVECTMDGVDPALKASRMTVEEIGQELRNEGVWFNGVDWVERRANLRREEADRERRRGGTRQKEEDESSTISSVKSDASHETSPVLSTTTLQTTPSPPPSNGAELKDTKESVASDPPAVDTAPPQWPIAIGPNLNPPLLLHSIPFIPETLEHLPQYSRETFISVRIKNMSFFSYLQCMLIAYCQVWREATIPLYHCRCRICERAIQVENMANGMVVAPVTTAAENTKTNVVSPAVVESPPVARSQPVEIRHGQLPRIEIGDGAEQEVEEEDYLTSASVTESTTTTDAAPPHVRKRPLDEIDGGEGLEYADEVCASEDADAASSNGADEYEDAVSPQDATPLYEKHTTVAPPIANVQLSVTTAAPTTVANMTPTKKRRTSGTYSPAVSPARVRKRSSEELEADDLDYEIPGGQREASTVTTKRVRTSPEPVNGEKPPAVIMKVPPHLS